MRCLDFLSRALSSSAVLLLMTGCAAPAGQASQEAAAPVMAPGACLHAGRTYAAGTLSCQGNYQNQCRDGRWVPLSMPC